MRVKKEFEQVVMNHTAVQCVQVSSDTCFVRQAFSVHHRTSSARTTAESGSPNTNMPAGPTKKSSKHAPRDRRSSSRQSTPLSAIADTAPPTPLAATPTSAAGPSQAPPPPPRNMAKETAYIHTSTAALVSADASIDILIERSSAGGGKANDPPSARELHALHDRIRDSVNKLMGRRGEVCDRSMRQLVQKRKERLAAEREREAARAEEAARVKREEEEREMKVKKKGAAASGRKRTAEEMEGLEESVKGERRDSWPSVGAHGMARQDGVGVHEGMLVSSLAAFGAFTTP